MSFYKNNKTYVIKLLSILFFLIFIYIFMKYCFSYVMPFIFGYAISLIMLPFINFFNERLKINKTISMIISMSLLIFTIGILGNLIIIKIIKEGSAFLKNVPDLLVYVDNAISNFKISYNKINLKVPIELQEYVNNLKTSLTNFIIEMLGVFFTSSSKNILAKVPKFVIGFVIGLLSSYFFAKDRNIIIKYFNKIIPEESKSVITMFKKRVACSIIGYFKAQFIIISIISIISIIGLSILKMPYAVFLGVLIAFVDALPVFGSGLFYWPWITFSFITGNYYNTLGLCIIYILIFLTRYIMEPRVVGKQIGIHPLAALISIYIGLNIFGFLGIILGPCIVVIIKSILEF